SGATRRVSRSLRSGSVFISTFPPLIIYTLQLAVELLFLVAKLGRQLRFYACVKVTSLARVLEVGHALAGQLECPPVLGARRYLESQLGPFGGRHFHFAAQHRRIKRRLHGH